jgi:hypothetical protein
VTCRKTSWTRRHRRVELEKSCGSQSRTQVKPTPDPMWLHLVAIVRKLGTWPGPPNHRGSARSPFPREEEGTLGSTSCTAGCPLGATSTADGGWLLGEGFLSSLSASAKACSSPVMTTVSPGCGRQTHCHLSPRWNRAFSVRTATQIPRSQFCPARSV